MLKIQKQRTVHLPKGYGRPLRYVVFHLCKYLILEQLIKKERKSVGLKCILIFRQRSLSRNTKIIDQWDFCKKKKLAISGIFKFMML